MLLTQKENLTFESLLNTLNVEEASPPLVSRDDVVFPEKCGSSKLVSRVCRVNLSGILTGPGEGKLLHSGPRHGNKV